MEPGVTSACSLVGDHHLGHARRVDRHRTTGRDQAATAAPAPASFVDTEPQSPAATSEEPPPPPPPLRFPSPPVPKLPGEPAKPGPVRPLVIGSMPPVPPAVAVPAPPPPPFSTPLPPLPPAAPASPPCPPCPVAPGMPKSGLAWPPPPPLATKTREARSAAWRRTSEALPPPPPPLPLLTLRSQLSMKATAGFMQHELCSEDRIKLERYLRNITPLALETAQVVDAS